MVGTFRELGPPDLCHVIKSSGSKAAQKDVSLPASMVSRTLTAARVLSLLVRSIEHKRVGYRTDALAQVSKLRHPLRSLHTSTRSSFLLKNPRLGLAKETDGK